MHESICCHIIYISTKRKRKHWKQNEGPPIEAWINQFYGMKKSAIFKKNELNYTN